MGEAAKSEALKGLIQSQLFYAVSETELKNFSKIVRLRTVKSGETVFSEGENAEGFYIISSGKIKIYKISAAGKSQVIHLFGPGSPFGEAAIFMDNKFPAYAEAVTGGTLIYITFKDFLIYLKKEPQFALNTIAALCMRLKSFLKTIEELSMDEISTRLAKYIIKTVEQSGRELEDGVQITLNIKKNLLAGQLGTIPETLSRTFQKLKKLGIIKIDGKRINILNAAALSRMSG